MRRAMTRFREFLEPEMLDREVWEAPARLSDDDLYAQAGPDFRRAPCPLHEPEEDR